MRLRPAHHVLAARSVKFGGRDQEHRQERYHRPNGPSSQVLAVSRVHAVLRRDCGRWRVHTKLRLNLKHKGCVVGSQGVSSQMLASPQFVRCLGGEAVIARLTLRGRTQNEKCSAQNSSVPVKLLVSSMI